MPRILALDVGDKTIGTAITDESETFALPQTTLLRQPGKRKDAAALATLIREKEVVAVVVGLPLHANGDLGSQAEKVQDFVATLRNYIRIPVYFQDERLTTWEAEQPLIEAGLSPKERKKVIDSLAASLILKSWLEQRASHQQTGDDS